MKGAEKELAQRQLDAAWATPGRWEQVGGLLPWLPSSWMGGSGLGAWARAVLPEAGESI